MAQKALLDARRKDIKKAVYTGAVTIGLSIPVIVVNYIPVIENFIKNRDINPRTIGETGLIIGTNILINGVIRSIEYLRIVNEFDRRYSIESCMRDPQNKSHTNVTITQKDEVAAPKKSVKKDKRKFRGSTNNPRFKKD